MIRKGLVITLMILTLFVGCSNEGIDPNATGSVRITIPAARTLLPAMPDVLSLANAQKEKPPRTAVRRG